MPAASRSPSSWHTPSSPNFTTQGAMLWLPRWPCCSSRTFLPTRWVARLPQFSHAPAHVTVKCCFVYVSDNITDTGRANQLSCLPTTLMCDVDHRSVSVRYRQRPLVVLAIPTSYQWVGNRDFLLSTLSSVRASVVCMQEEGLHPQFVLHEYVDVESIPPGTYAYWSRGTVDHALFIILFSVDMT